MPGVHGEDLADAAGLDEFHARAVFLCRMNLVTHLGAHLRLRGLEAQLTRFPGGVGERLLAVDMLTHAHGDHGGQRVHVVRGRHGHGVKAVAEPSVHLSPIAVMRHAGMALVYLGEASGIDVAEAHEMGLGVRGTFGDIAVALAVDPDRGDLDLRVQIAGPDNRREGEGRQRSGTQKVSTG